MTSHSSHYIDGQWVHSGEQVLVSTNPATGATLWTGRSGGAAEVDQAVSAAAEAQPDWADTPLEQRIAYLKRFAGQLTAHKQELAETISIENGKPRWDALGEMGAMIAKIDVSIEAYHARRSTQTCQFKDAVGTMRFKPHGVMAVLGPFNFPGHVSNGHIVPALLAGNTVVFKPSEKTPLVACKTVELWHAAKLPAGIINMVQGAGPTGLYLSQHSRLDGLLFTGGCCAGLAIGRAFSEQPEKILALELGGNNPLVVHEAGDLDAAAYLTMQSAYITSGQRCTCARRLIVLHGSAGDAFIDRFTEVVRTIRFGPYTDTPEPFMGPMIDGDAADKVLARQSELVERGAKVLTACEPRADCRAMLSPGLLDVTDVADRGDEEIFGPLLQVIRVANFEGAIDEANHTRYGLVAGLLSDSRSLYDQFCSKVRAGLINWNRPTTGASSLLPFGGIGLSGNHRPTGYYAADYCSYPVASIEAEQLTLPQSMTPGTPGFTL